MFQIFVSGMNTANHRPQSRWTISNDGMTTCYVFFFISFLSTCIQAHAPSVIHHDVCEPKILSKPRIATHLNFDLSYQVMIMMNKINENSTKFPNIAKELLSTKPQIIGVFLSSETRVPILALNLKGRLKVFPNKTMETAVFWNSFSNATNGWNPPFRDCHLIPRTWFHLYMSKHSNASVGVLLPLKVNQCDNDLEEIFGGVDKCDPSTTYVSKFTLLLEKITLYLSLY